MLLVVWWCLWQAVAPSARDWCPRKLPCCWPACLQVAVVCAGAKSVLDIPRTLEFLETQVG